MRILILLFALFALTFTANAATITKSGNILTITGPIESGDGKKFKKLFTKEINHIKLKSEGGSVWPGTTIANAIHKRKTEVVTEAFGYCESMCAVIWMSSDKHVYNKDAQLGWHLSYIQDLDFWKDELDRYGFNGVEYVHKSGVLRDISTYLKYFNNLEHFKYFIDKLKSKGLLSYEMWYPTDKELVMFEGEWVQAPGTELLEGVSKYGAAHLEFITDTRMVITVTDPKSYFYQFTGWGSEEIKYADITTDLTKSTYNDFTWNFITYAGVNSMTKSQDSIIVDFTGVGQAQLFKDMLKQGVKIAVASDKLWAVLTFYVK